jgi:hypothetical protein
VLPYWVRISMVMVFMLTPIKNPRTARSVHL